MMAKMLCGVFCIVALTACTGGQTPDDTESTDSEAGEPSPEGTTLAAVKQATTKFQDVSVAEAEGYIQDPTGHCVDAKMVGAPEALGGMGVHYLRPDLLGVAMPPAPGRITGDDAVFDPSRPEILVYEPQADRSMQLVAVEYIVFEKAWREAGNSTPPSFAGTTFATMTDDPATELDEAHGFEPHHELHVWLYRDNANGMYAEFNPAVTCAHAGHAG